MQKSLLLSLACCTLIQASDPVESKAVFDTLTSLSMEDLMNIEVTSTSKRKEPQHLAPGIITVVDSQEIHQYGALNLRDVLDRIVGMRIGSSHYLGATKSSIRGMNADSYDAAMLVLLNGRPMRSASLGGNNFDLYGGFPLETIDRIEIIRGPGSVIYGTNAMAGVINIITKDAHESLNETRVDIGGGSFNRRQLQLSTLTSGEEYSLNIGVNSVRSHGDEFEGVQDNGGNHGTYVNGDRNDNLMVDAKYKNFTLTGLYMSNNPDRYGAVFQFPASELNKKRYFFDTGYRYDIAQGWDVSLNYTLNAEQLDWQVSQAAGQNHLKDRSETIEATVHGNLTEDLNLLFGVTRNNDSSAFDKFLPPVQSQYRTAYTQIDYMLSPKQKIIAGAQWNKSENIDAHISPRVGFIQGFGENWWLKLLYSEAYKSATLLEKHIASPGVVFGNPNLNPEQTATYDVQLIYKSAQHYLALTLYDTMHKNLVSRSGPLPQTFTNQGFVRYQGMEMEGRLQTDEAINLIGNFSYQSSITNDGVKNQTFAPQMMAKLGGTYERIHGVSIGVFNSYIGKSEDLAVTGNADALALKSDAYNFLTANISVDTGKRWGMGKPEHSLLSLYLDNILDEKINTPDLLGGTKTNAIPSRWGRGAYLTYTYKF